MSAGKIYEEFLTFKLSLSARPGEGLCKNPLAILPVRILSPISVGVGPEPILVGVGLPGVGIAALTGGGIGDTPPGAIPPPLA